MYVYLLVLNLVGCADTAAKFSCCYVVLLHFQQLNLAARYRRILRIQLVQHDDGTVDLLVP